MAYVEVLASPAKMLTTCSLQNDGVKLDFIEKWVLKVKYRKWKSLYACRSVQGFFESAFSKTVSLLWSIPYLAMVGVNCVDL